MSKNSAHLWARGTGAWNEGGYVETQVLGIPPLGGSHTLYYVLPRHPCLAGWAQCVGVSQVPQLVFSCQLGKMSLRPGRS